MERARPELLSNYVEKLYDEPQKLHGAQLLAQLSFEQSALGNLLDDFVLRGINGCLADDHDKNPDLYLPLFTVLCRLSHYRAHHTALLKHNVLQRAVACISFELSRGVAWLKDIESDAKVKARLTSELRDKVIKQDRLLVACVTIVSNLCESDKAEVEVMRLNGGIIKLLAGVFSHSEHDLLLIAAKLLVRFSSKQECVAECHAVNMVALLIKLMPCDQVDVSIVFAQALHNLCLDTANRSDLIDCQGISTLLTVAEMSESDYDAVIDALYVLSLDPDMRGAFTYTPRGLGVLLDRLCDDDPPMSLCCLMINLASNAILLEQHAESVGRLFMSSEPAVIKVIRNLSVHIRLSQSFGMIVIDHIDKLITSLVTQLRIYITSPTGVPPSLPDLLCVFANFRLETFHYGRLIRRFQQLIILRDVLDAANSSRTFPSDDVILHVVMIIGVWCIHEEVAVWCCEANVDKLIVSILLRVSSSNDYDLILQLLHDIKVMLLQKQTALQLCANPSLQSLIIGLLVHCQPAVRSVAMDVAEYLIDISPNFAEVMRSRRFREYNSEWIRITSQSSGEVHQTMTAKDKPMPTAVTDAMGEIDFLDDEIDDEYLE